MMHFKSIKLNTNCINFWKTVFPTVTLIDLHKKGRLGLFSLCEVIKIEQSVEWRLQDEE